MAKDLQKPGHLQRDYNRPNCKWTCGHSQDGRQCPLGPSAKGGCRGTSECLPIMKGDRWHCTRPNSIGGECPEGPTSSGKCGCPLAPCTPNRSLREVRKLVSIGVILLTIGFLLIVLPGESNNSTVNSGRLTTAHAGENLKCQSCHVESSLAELASLADPHFLESRSIANSKLCLECHGDEIGPWTESARFAHGWPPDHASEKTIQAISKLEDSSETKAKQLSVWIASKGPTPAAGINGGLDCATCHQEHHGADYSLTTLSNQQCQVCHQNQFHSFEDGHPTFLESNYPYSRRTRIYFDHNSHYLKHFEEKSEHMDSFDKDAPFADNKSCLQCHVTDDNGDYMKLKGFEASCAACHDETTTSGDPLTLLAIPEIHSAEGQWPKSGYGLIPSMRLLLDEGLNNELSSGQKEEDEFGTIPLTGKDEAESAAKVATGLQNLFHESWNSGPEFLSTRVADQGFGNDTQNRALYAGLSVDTLRQFLFPGMKRNLGEFAFPALDLKSLDKHLRETGDRSIGSWPDHSAAPLTPLLRSILAYRPASKSQLKTVEESLADEEDIVRLDDLSKASPEVMAAVEKLAWEIKILFFEIRISGTPFLEQYDTLRGGIIDMKSPDAVWDKAFVTASSDSEFSEGLKQELVDYANGVMPPPVAPPKDAKPAPAASGGDDDFGPDDDFGAPAPKKNDDDFGDSEPAPKKADDDFGSDDDFGDSKPDTEPVEDDFGAPEEKEEKEPASGKEKFTVFEPDPVEWQKMGGWLYENYAIRYRSQGHSDPLIKAWIETAISAANSGDERIRSDGKRLLNHTLEWKSGVATNASGKCFKCHTVDRDPTGRYSINWLGVYSTPKISNLSSELTHFSHDKHSIALNCTTCHSPKQKGNYADFFETAKSSEPPTNPTQFSSNFEPLNDKTSCANCHQKSKAGNSCLECHDYHSNPAMHWKAK